MLPILCRYRSPNVGFEDPPSVWRLGSLAKILDILERHAKKSKNFLRFLSTILKNFEKPCAHLPKNNCQDLCKKFQKSKKFLPRKQRRQAVSIVSGNSLDFPKCIKINQLPLQIHQFWSLSSGPKWRMQWYVAKHMNLWNHLGI